MTPKATTATSRSKRKRDFEDGLHAGGNDEAGDGDAVLHRKKADGLGNDVRPVHDQHERYQHGCRGRSKAGTGARFVPERLMWTEPDGQEGENRNGHAEKHSAGYAKALASGQVDLRFPQEVQHYERDDDHLEHERQPGQYEQVTGVLARRQHPGQSRHGQRLKGVQPDLGVQQRLAQHHEDEEEHKDGDTPR